MEKVSVADRQAEQELTASHVIDDLHGLQDRAGTQLAVPRAGGEQHQLQDSGGLHRLWDGELEVTPEVTHGILLHVFDEGAVAGDLEIQLVILEETSRCFGARQIQPVPVDHGTATQNEPQRLDVVQREIFDALQSERAFTRTRARRFAVGQSQWFVVVALPAVGRPKAKVPKKMPIVTPSTASCAPNGPFAAISATGIGATRYHGFNFILGSPTERRAARVY